MKEIKRKQTTPKQNNAITNKLNVKTQTWKGKEDYVHCG
jgi:hypothetical protein